MWISLLMNTSKQVAFLDLVKKFIQIAEQEKLPIEAILLSTVDEVLIEHHFIENKKRNIYSHSKSFVSAMVGIALLEKKITLNDKIINYLKDILNESEREKLSKIRIEDLLTMRSGFGEPILMMGDREKALIPDFTRYMMSFPIKYQPGTHFCYSNGDTYILARVLEGVYGVDFYSLINEKLFKLLDIQSPEWECDKSGHCFGASGLVLDIKDMNKLARLFLNDGVWNNKQIIDPDYIKECRKIKVNLPDNSWFGYGYTYQFWKVRYYDSYRADGAFGQITYILDDIGLALSIQCPENGNLNLVLDKIRDLIFEKAE